MGKKSLIKSTSKKKKAASRKKDDDETKKTIIPETTRKAAPGKKAAAKRAAPPKTVAAKKAAPGKDSTLKDLLFRKFDKEIPAELFKAEPAKGDFTAPPLISTTDTKEAERLKALLFRKFDLAAPAEKKTKAEKPTEPTDKKDVPAAEKKAEKPVEEKNVEKPDPKEIMARKFFEAPPADSLFAPEAERESVPSAPPLISTSDEEEAAWLKKLLFRKIDLTTPVEKRKPAPEPEAPAEPVEEAPAEAVEEAPAEAEKEEKIEEPAGKPEAEAAAPEEVLPEKTPEVVEPEKVETPEESPKVTVSYDEPPPTDTEVSDPMEKMIKYAAAGFILILLLIVGYSFDNRANYYIQPDDDGIEILRGNFAPLGKDVVAELEGVPAPEVVKEVYAAEEVLPLAFNYYVDRADKLMSVNGLPDLQNIQTTLGKALEFATTKEQYDSVYSRMNSLEALVLQYKANVAAERGTSWDVAAAIEILEKALRLNTNENEKAMIQSRIDYLQKHRNELEVSEAEAKAAAAAAEIQPAEEEAIEEPASKEAAPAVEDEKAAEEGEAGEKEGH